MFRIALVAISVTTTNAARTVIYEKNNDHYSSKGLNADASQHAYCRLKGTRERGDSRRELIGKVYRASGWSFLKATGLNASAQTNTESWTVVTGLPKTRLMPLTVLGLIGEYYFDKVNSCTSSTAPVNGAFASGSKETIVLDPVLRGKTKVDAISETV